ncbi:MAG: hypothetical protein ACFFCE_01020 [Promethearchaeota archaeon]
MKKNKKITYIVVSMVVLQLFISFSIPKVKATINIPDEFNKKLDLDEVYIYNVTAFNTTKPLEWLDVDWTAPSKGFANTTAGGQIKVSFTGFYDKDPNDFFNIFGSPMPYMDIEFIENRFGNLVSNATFYNISNGEADLNLLLGYNRFKSGFLIPINNISGLRKQAYTQNEPPYMNATVTIQETSTRITFDFQQKTGLEQKTKSTYDKISGLLVNTNTSVGNYTLEMTLINFPSFSSEEIFIPAYQVYLIFGITLITITVTIAKLKKRK